MKMRYALRALAGIMRREILRFVGQHGRFAAAIVRPLVWLGIFAAGFRSVLGLSIIPPYQTYILYEVYIVPGLVGMMLLFHGMQSSLSMVYDREMGSMRVLLTAPLPRWWLLGARLLANTVTVLPIVYLFLLLARFWDVRPPVLGYVTALPALILAGLMLGAFGLALSSMIRQLENFAGVMNFVIFPLFFASTALYPLWRLEEVSPGAGDHRLDEPVLPCHRADPLRALSPVRTRSLCRLRVGLRCFLWARGLGLRSGAGLLGAPGGRVILAALRGTWA
jgi:ABC-2 type transport system permease protein